MCASQGGHAAPSAVRSVPSFPSPIPVAQETRRTHRASSLTDPGEIANDYYNHVKAFYDAKVQSNEESDTHHFFECLRHYYLNGWNMTSFRVCFTKSIGRVSLHTCA
jgi:hypothetical protein